MPNQLSPLVEERIVAFALGHPGLGPAADRHRARAPALGRARRLANGVWRCLRRHGLNTRAKRLSLVAGYARALRAATRARAGAARRGRAAGRAGRHRLLLRRPAAGTKETVWQLTAIDLCSSLRLGRTRLLPGGSPRARRPRSSPGASQRDCRPLAGGSSGCSPTTAASFAARLPAHARATGRPHTRIRAGRPQTNGAVEALHKPILEECWRPAFARYLHAPLHRPPPRPRQLPALLQPRARPHRPPHPRTHPRRHRLRCPQGGDEMSRTCRHISEAVHSSARGGARLTSCVCRRSRSKGEFVIARLARGWTSADDAETYAAYVQATGITDYQRTPAISARGCCGDGRAIALSS